MSGQRQVRARLHRLHPPTPPPLRHSAPSSAPHRAWPGNKPESVPRPTQAQAQARAAVAVCIQFHDRLSVLRTCEVAAPAQPHPSFHTSLSFLQLLSPSTGSDSGSPQWQGALGPGARLVPPRVRVPRAEPQATGRRRRPRALWGIAIEDAMLRYAACGADMAALAGDGLREAKTRRDKTRQEKFTQMAQDTTSQDSTSHKTKSRQNKTTTATTIKPSHKTRRDKPRHDKTNPERAKTRQRPPSFPLPLLFIHSFCFTLLYL